MVGRRSFFGVIGAAFTSVAGWPIAAPSWRPDPPGDVIPPEDRFWEEPVETVIGGEPTPEQMAETRELQAALAVVYAIACKTDCAGVHGILLPTFEERKVCANVWFGDDGQCVVEMLRHVEGK